MANLEFKNRNINIKGALPTNEMQFLRASVKEGFSQLTEISLEFLSDKNDTALEDILGEMATITFQLPDGSDRFFSGYCVSAEYVGMFLGLNHFKADLRPWLWFLKRTEENRIYQGKSAVDIIKEIFGDYGFSSALKDKLNRSCETRTYCVQYAETDFDFVSRLMEEEGIYYFFEYEDGAHKLVLADGISGHQNIVGESTLEFYKPDNNFRRDNDHFWDWKDNERLRSGKVTLDDYDFTSPRADQKKVNIKETGKHKYKKYEQYRYPGHVRAPTGSDHFARVQMESEAVQHKTMTGEGNVRAIAVGGKFSLSKHDRTAYNQDYLVTTAVHFLQSNHLIEAKLDAVQKENLAAKDDKTPDQPKIWSKTMVDDENYDAYRNTIEVIPSKIQYRARLVTEWPRITGLQTAVVTGPSGEEIYTDEYGRIKVQFHWDRHGAKDENTTCWIRCVMPWTGKSWGMISIPRIGNEVVIQFEEGDPDRPICTGMLYNKDNMPPYDLPANMTQTGMKTRSTKQGSTSTHHELVFEDKKGSEYVRMQSERDYLQVIKNNALINIGGGHKDQGDLTQIVHRNKTEVVGDVRTHVVGILDDLTVGMVYDEAVGMVKTQTVGIYKEEKIGLTMPSLKNVVSDSIGLAVTIGGPISTLAFGGKYADFGAAATAINSLWSGRQAGKKEEINGKSELIVTGDRIERISKSKAPAAGKPGNMHTFVEDGNQLVSVLKGDRQIGVEKGDLITGVDTGDYKTTIAKGNHETKVSKGDLTAKISKGKVKIEAKKSIELKVGSNSIKIDTTGITIKGAMIKNQAKSLFKADAKMVTVSGKMTMIDGKMVMIN